MKCLIAHLWLITEQGKVLTSEQHSEAVTLLKKPIKVIGYKWQTDDAAKTTITKRFENPKYGVLADVLSDRSGLIMSEPPEIVGDKLLVVYDADGSERFRVNARIDPLKFPAYLHKACLVGYQIFSNKPYAHFQSDFGDRVLEFDMSTGVYTGVHWEVR